MINLNLGAAIGLTVFMLLIGIVLGGASFNYNHDCPEPTKGPVTLVADCDFHEQLIGQVATELYINKLALDDALERLNACTLDLAVERGELPPLPKK